MKHILTIAILFPLVILNSCSPNKNKEDEKKMISNIEEYKNFNFHYSVDVKSV